MRIVQHPGRRTVRRIAALVGRKAGHVGRLRATDPGRPWERGWGALWYDIGCFAGLVSPRGRPDSAWLFAGRNGAPAYVYTVASRLDRISLTVRNDMQARGVAKMVERVLAGAGTDPAIMPP